MTRRDDIDRLARLLEGEQGAHAEAVGEELQLAGLASALRSARPPVPAMRSEFRTALRAQVLDASRAQQAEPALLTQLRDGIRRFKYSSGFAGATGMASVAIAGGGVAGAAEHAQPGDALYGTKLVLEDARLLLTLDDVAAGQRALAYAQDRVEEAGRAATAGDDEGAARALSVAADRVAHARGHVQDSGMVAPLLDVLDTLDVVRARLADLQPLLQAQAAAAAGQLDTEVGRARAAVADRIAVPGGPATQDPTPGPTGPAVAPPAGDEPPAAPPPGEGQTPVDPPAVAPGADPTTAPVPAPDPDASTDVIPGEVLDVVPDTLEELQETAPLDDIDGLGDGILGGD